MRTACIFRIIVVPGNITGPRYRCLAGDVEFVAGAENAHICDQCSIPELMAEKHCLYLEPTIRFLKGTDSVVVLRCTKLDTILPIKHYCQQCPSYICCQSH
ncbi:MAG: hypothetical protein GX489_07555 [Firmicutes bacterium]|nr:hypothetical protein [Bacillota bacterium]